MDLCVAWNKKANATPKCNAIAYDADLTFEIAQQGVLTAMRARVDDAKADTERRVVW